MIPKSRLDALTDGVFAFAMTLLVLDLRLPDTFHPASTAELLGGLRELSGQFLAYMISFFVLGIRWLAQAGARGVPETTSGRYGRWVLVYLFFITCIPFSTMVIGRYDDLAPAAWLYAANMILSALASLRMSFLAEEEANRAADRRSRVVLLLLIVTALLSVAMSFVTPAYATLAYLPNALPLLVRKGTKHT